MSEFKKNVFSVKIKKSGCHTALKIVAPPKKTWRQNNIKYIIWNWAYWRKVICEFLLALIEQRIQDDFEIMFNVVIGKVVNT